MSEEYPSTDLGNAGNDGEIRVEVELPFSLAKRPFSSPGDQREFSSKVSRVPDREAGTLVVRSTQNKRKSDMMGSIVEANEWSTSPGYEVSSSILNTPVSGKAAKATESSRFTKNHRNGPHTPMSNAGSLMTRCPAKVMAVSMGYREMQERPRDLSEDEHNQRLLFIMEDDIKALPCFQNETLIAIKAPHGTTLEVPDPDEALDYSQRRYRIVLRSTMGPIDVYLVSHFEERFEDIDGSEVPLSYRADFLNTTTAAASVLEDNSRKGKVVPGEDAARTYSDLNTLQDIFGGFMKIIPSGVDSVADYWLLSDADVSMTDIWTERILPWCLNVFGFCHVLMQAIPG